MKCGSPLLVLGACAQGLEAAVLHSEALAHATVVGRLHKAEIMTITTHTKMEATTMNFLIYGGVAIFIALAIGACAFGIARKRAAGEDNEKAEALSEEATAGGMESTGAEVNVERLFKLIAKRTAQQVGPKLSKANKVKNVLEKRIFGFKNKAATFVMDELYGVVARILREVEAEEAMLLLDPAAAAQANLPPASILLAGLLSPIVLTVSMIVHLSQIFLVLIPVLFMCAWALYTDWLTIETCAVPTINFWIYCQAGLAALLMISHVAMTHLIVGGKQSIRDKMDSMQDKLRAALSDGELSIQEVRDLFLVSAILLEHALVVEDGLRRSFWRTIIGYGTIAWMAMTLWTFVLVLGWTFVPGMVAFHPSAVAVAGKDFCGAWATVFTARLSCVLSLLFLMFNVLSVLQWVSDKLVTSESYSAAMIHHAKQFDANAGGFPVMQTLVKAFLLRGNGDSIKDQIAQSYNRKAGLQKQAADLEGRIATLKGRIDGHKAEAAALKAAHPGLDNDSAEDAKTAEMQLGAEAAAEEMQRKAKEIEESTMRELNAMMEKFKEAAAQVQNSEVMQGAMRQAQEMQTKLQETGVQGLQDAATSGLASAQQAAGEAAAVAQEHAGRLPSAQEVQEQARAAAARQGLA